MRKPLRIRTKFGSNLEGFGLGEIEPGKILHRQDALARVSSLLSQSQLQDPEVLRLISLFQLQPEELTEAGVSYEVVKALERQAGFL